MEHLFSPQNSNSRDKKYTKNALILTDRLITDMYRLQIDRTTDDALNRYLDHFQSQVSKIEMNIKANPRYVWQEIQDTFDYMYKRNKAITGADVHFTWNHDLPPFRLQYDVNF